MPATAASSGRARGRSAARALARRRALRVVPGRLRGAGCEEPRVRGARSWCRASRDPKVRAALTPAARTAKVPIRFLKVPAAGRRRHGRLPRALALRRGSLRRPRGCASPLRRHPGVRRRGRHRHDARPRRPRRAALRRRDHPLAGPHGRDAPHAHPWHPPPRAGREREARAGPSGAPRAMRSGKARATPPPPRSTALVAEGTVLAGGEAPRGAHRRRRAGGAPAHPVALRAGAGPGAARTCGALAAAATAALT